MEKLNFGKFKTILPSGKFLKLIGISAGGVLILLIITSYLGSKNSFTRGKQSLVEANGTVADLVTKDSNNNGIADWEESLWGLDPKGDGTQNAETIKNKKAASGIQTTDATDDKPATPNDQFSQSLFATIMALQQSGSLTPEAVTNLASSIGDNVDTKHVTAKVYTRADMSIIDATPDNKEAYRVALKTLISDFSNVDLGDEMPIIAKGLGSGGATALQKLQPMADAYGVLSKKIIALPTPSDIAGDALNLANAESVMSVTLPQIEGVYTDALTGMVGVDDFIKANTISNQASKNIKLYFAS